MNKLRIACPLTTFHENEAFEAAGFIDSYFIPKENEILREDSIRNTKKGRQKSAESVTSRSSTKKDKKIGGGVKKGQIEGKNLQEVTISKLAIINK